MNEIKLYDNLEDILEFDDEYTKLNNIKKIHISFDDKLKKYRVEITKDGE